MNAKKYICIIIAFLLCLAFAACATNTPEPISNSSEGAKSEPVSQVIEIPAESSAKDEPEEEPSEQSEEGTASEPFLSEDPESVPYRVLGARNAKELAAKLIELDGKLQSNEIKKLSPDEPDYFANLGKIIADGYVFNPSVDGEYAEIDAPDDDTDIIEAIFWEDKTVAIIYYCCVGDDKRVRVTVEYPNDDLKALVRQYGVDGYRMYHTDDKKPLSEYTEQEKAQLGTTASFEKIAMANSEYDAVKYGKSKRDDTYLVRFELDNKIVSISYKYMGDVASQLNPDNILKTIRFDKVELGEQSKESNVSEPFLSIDPEGFPYRTLYASNAKEMTEKLLALKSKLADDSMQKFDPAKLDYFANLDKMLADGYIFNPSYDGIYADTDYDRTIEATFWEDKTAVIWYHITVDNTRIDIQISYLNNEIEQLIDQYGIDGYRIYFSEDKKPLSEYSVAEKASLRYKSVSITDQEICGKTVPSIRYLERVSDKSNIVSLLYDNKVISVIYCCYDDETTTTLPAIEDIVKEIRLETVSLK